MTFHSCSNVCSNEEENKSEIMTRSFINVLGILLINISMLMDLYRYDQFALIKFFLFAFVYFLLINNFINVPYI